jgi:hypothetical protein
MKDHVGLTKAATWNYFTQSQTRGIALSKVKRVGLDHTKSNLPNKDIRKET